MSHFEANRCDLDKVSRFRKQYAAEANCQIVHYTSLSRGFADAYLLKIDSQPVGHGGVFHTHYPGRLHEFFVLPEYRSHASQLLAALIEQSKATEFEAQTNMPFLYPHFAQFGSEVVSEALLFADDSHPSLNRPGCVFREVLPHEHASIFEHHAEPVGRWCIERDGRIIATGGYFTHYNPPYGDVFMEVESSARRQGVGSYLVQEVMRVCREAGLVPSARCGCDNIASRRTLERAGFRMVGELVSTRIQPKAI